MQLAHLMEAADLDVEALAEQARRAGCRGPLVIGGSLADGLGTALSDIDLMCFEPSADAVPGAQRVSVSRHRWGRLDVDLHRVDVPTLVDICAPYRAHLLAAPARPVDRLPHDIFVLMHALHSGIPVDGTADLEELADLTGTDLYPTLLGLRALGILLNHWRDARQFEELALGRPALVAARSAVEAAADAALAMAGRVNPNPKWRIVQLQRAARDPRTQASSWSGLIDGIIDPQAVGGPRAVLATAVSVAADLAAGSELALYHEAALVLAQVEGDRRPALTGGDR